MNKTEIIKRTKNYIRSALEGEGTGHDWYHAERVWKTAKIIAKKEGADLFVVELAALLHDVADWKFHSGDDKASSKVANTLLKKLKVNPEIIEHVCRITEYISFKGAGVKNKINTLEGMVVQDADRLDALGAIGIARTFAYGGASGREIYNPKLKPKKHKSFDQYKNSKSASINHFYEKLLLLKDMMNTKTGKKLAEKRHRFMLAFLKEFYEEWDTKNI